MKRNLRSHMNAKAPLATRITTNRMIYPASSRYKSRLGSKS